MVSSGRRPLARSARVTERRGLGGVGLGEVDGGNVALEEVLNDVGVLLEEGRAHDQVSGHVLAAGPEGLLVDEDLALGLLDHPGGPGLGHPGAGDRAGLEDRLAEAGVPLRADREAAWRDFAGWRVNYDTVLIIMAGFVMAPYAPWISDRSPAGRYRPPILMRRRRGPRV